MCEIRKPKCKLVGEDGNVFNIIGRVQGALNKAGMVDRGKEWAKRAMEQQSYDDVLVLLHEYVEAY